MTSADGRQLIAEVAGTCTASATRSLVLAIRDCVFFVETRDPKNGARGVYAATGIAAFRAAISVVFIVWLMASAYASLCAAGAAVGALVFGYSLGFSSPALPGMLGRQFKHVRCDANGASAAAASLWSAVINIGAAVGALAGGRLVDNVGRKGALLYVAGPLYVVAWTRAESKP